MKPTRGRLPVALLLVWLCAGCVRPDRPLSGGDIRAIYDATLAAIFQELGPQDSLIVDPRPYYVIEEGDGSHRMGTFNSYGDPIFSQAITAAPDVHACTLERFDDARGEPTCSQAGHPRFVQISEALPLGRRDVGVLVAALDMRSGGTAAVRGFVLTAREAGGVWRVVRVAPGDVARLR